MPQLTQGEAPILPGQKIEIDLNLIEEHQRLSPEPLTEEPLKALPWFVAPPPP